MRIKPVHIFSLLAGVILVISLILYSMFTQTKQMVIDTNLNTNISYVKNISTNISNYILSQIDNDFEKLKDPKIRLNIEDELSLFITNRYKYIYVVDKKEGEYRFLLDGSEEDKALYLEPYTPLQIDQWDKVFKTKKEVYFTHNKIHNLWLTYLKPIIIKNQVKAVLVIDFSINEHSKISKSLIKLDNLFKFSVLFFMIIVGIIIWFSFIDIKREKEKQKVQKDLEVSLKQLSKLNETLEESIKKEVEKNRQKDKQLLYQSRLAQMGEMMSMIAHQWRQPLGSIASIVLSMRVKIEFGMIDNNFLKNKIELILHNTDYLSKTIDDFRNFFQPTKEKELVSFSEVLNSVLDIANISLKNRDIKINKNLEFDEKIEIFVNEFKQVILNFIKNAEDVLVERDIEKREINICSFKRNQYIVFEVEDNGGGITDEIIDKIFDPYFSTKTSKNGTGLGLYMSKIIVEEHLKGKLRVYNSSRGAVFEIILKESEL